jgi:hypothetical protein
MSGARITLLNSIDFVWEPATRQAEILESNWNSMYHLLKDYATEHNHTCPSRRRLYKGQDLGSWVVKQRHSYKLRQRGLLDASSSRMSDKRITLLNGIGFVWDLQRNPEVSESIWVSMYQLLKDYATKHNHTCPAYREKYKRVKVWDIG